MPGFEHDLYKGNLPEDQFNQRWWDLKKKYQGIVPPSERGEEYCDAASKTHINNDAAQYYDYAISYLLLFQFHDHIAKNILNQSPRATNYYGNTGVGDFLKKVMYPGASRDWRELMEENLGSGMSAAPMLEYFEPLMDHLKKENEGRTHTLPENLPNKLKRGPPFLLNNNSERSQKCHKSRTMQSVFMADPTDQGPETRIRAQIHLFDASNKMIGSVDFFEPGMELPSDSNEGRIIMAMHTPMMHSVIDVLRNEGPVYIEWQERLKNAYMGTSQEPVGEGENPPPRR